MKKNLKKVVLVLALLLPGVIKAQEFNVTAKADFVSDYIGVALTRIQDFLYSLH